MITLGNKNCELRRSFVNLLNICSIDELRVNLQGVYFNSGENTLVVTDGFILLEVKAEYYGFTEDDMNFLADKTIHKDQLKTIFKNYDKIVVKEDCFVCSSKKAKNVTFFFESINSKFPNYSHITKPVNFIEQDAMAFDFLKAAKIQKAIPNTSSLKVCFTGSNKVMTVVSGNPDYTQFMAYLMPCML